MTNNMKKITISCTELHLYEGKKIKIEKLKHSYTGILNRSTSTMAVGQDSVARAWKIQAGSIVTEFLPSDGWKIYLD